MRARRIRPIAAQPDFKQPLVRERLVEIDSQGGQRARAKRTARTEITIGQVELLPPQGRPTAVPLQMWLVRVLEPEPPPGEEALDWLLLSSAGERTAQWAERLRPPRECGQPPGPDIRSWVILLATATASSPAGQRSALEGLPPSPARAALGARPVACGAPASRQSLAAGRRWASLYARQTDPQRQSCAALLALRPIRSSAGTTRHDPGGMSAATQQRLRIPASIMSARSGLFNVRGAKFSGRAGCGVGLDKQAAGL